MAEQGYGCIFGDCTSQIDHIITTISSGASVSVCAEHYAPALIPLLAAELGVDPGEFYSYVEKYIARENKKAEKALADAQAAAAAEGSQNLPPELCGYCGNPLTDGESHLHGGQPNAEDLEPAS